MLPPSWISPTSKHGQLASNVRVFIRFFPVLQVIVAEFVSFFFVYGFGFWGFDSVSVFYVLHTVQGSSWNPKH